MEPWMWILIALGALLLFGLLYDLPARKAGIKFRAGRAMTKDTREHRRDIDVAPGGMEYLGHSWTHHARRNGHR